MNCLDVPKLRESFSRKINLAKFNFKVQKNLRMIEMLLRSSFPEKEIFSGCLQSFLSQQFDNDANALKAFYEIIEQAFSDRLSSYLLFAAEDKFVALSLPESAEIAIEDDSMHPTLRRAYADFLSYLTRTGQRGVERFYTNEDDLLYAIYVATETADFLTSYDYSVFTNIRNLFLDTEENPYGVIENLLRESQAPGKESFRKSLIERKVFLTSFRRTPSSYKNVIAELKQPYGLLVRSWNNKIYTRNNFLVLCEKLAVFEEFLRDFVEPEIAKEVSEIFATGKGDPRFKDSNEAFEFFTSQLRDLVVFLYNPYNEIEFEMENIDHVYNMFQAGDFRISNQARLGALRSAVGSELIDVNEIPKVKPTELSFEKKKTHIKVYKDKATPAEFSFLALGNTEKPFLSRMGKQFRSIQEFINFATLEEVFGMDGELAYQNRGDSKLLQKFFDEMLACSARDAINRHLAMILDTKFIKAKLESFPDTQFVLTLNVPSNPFFDFFQRFLGNSITNALGSSTKLIKNHKILEWIELRKDELVFIHDVVKDGSNVARYLERKESLFNLWSLVMGLERSRLIFRIESGEQSALRKLAEDYVLGELSFVASQGFDILELLEDEGERITENVEALSKDEVRMTIRRISLNINPYVISERSPDIASMIISSKRDMTMEKLVENSRRSLEVERRLKLFYVLHHIQEEEEFEDVF